MKYFHLVFSTLVLSIATLDAMEKDEEPPKSQEKAIIKAQNINFFATEDVLLKVNGKVRIPLSLIDYFTKKKVTLNKAPYPFATALMDLRNKHLPVKEQKCAPSRKEFHITAQRIKEDRADDPLYFRLFLLEEDPASPFKNKLTSRHALITKILRIAAWNHPRITIQCTLQEFINVFNHTPFSLQKKIVQSAQAGRCTFDKNKIRRNKNDSFCCSFDHVFDYVRYKIVQGK